MSDETINFSKMFQLNSKVYLKILVSKTEILSWLFFRLSKVKSEHKMIKMVLITSSLKTIDIN